jgi:hypothetical protein
MALGIDPTSEVPIKRYCIGIRSTTVRTGSIPPTPYPHISYFCVLLQTKRFPLEVLGYTDDIFGINRIHFSNKFSIIHCGPGLAMSSAIIIDLVGT